MCSVKKGFKVYSDLLSRVKAILYNAASSSIFAQIVCFCECGRLFLLSDGILVCWSLKIELDERKLFSSCYYTFTPSAISQEVEFDMIDALNRFRFFYILNYQSSEMKSYVHLFLTFSGISRNYRNYFLVFRFEVIYIIEVGSFLWLS